MNHQCHDNPKRILHENWRKSLLIANALSLSEFLCDKMCLIPFDIAFRIPLGFEYSFTTNRFFPLGNSTKSQISLSFIDFNSSSWYLTTQWNERYVWPHSRMWGHPLTLCQTRALGDKLHSHLQWLISSPQLISLALVVEDFQVLPYQHDLLQDELYMYLSLIHI